jgi:hypothetical protein
MQRGLLDQRRDEAVRASTQLRLKHVRLNSRASTGKLQARPGSRHHSTRAHLKSQHAGRRRWRFSITTSAKQSVHNTRIPCPAHGRGERPKCTATAYGWSRWCRAVSTSTFAASFRLPGTPAAKAAAAPNSESRIRTASTQLRSSRRQRHAVPSASASAPGKPRRATPDCEFK